MKPAEISLVITTYNWPEALDLVLESVSRQIAMPGEVIVADDGSGPPTAEVVKSWSSRLAVPVRHLWQEDIGFRLNRSRNRGIAAARQEYIVLLDGDMLLHKHFIADHAAAAEKGCFVQGVRLMTTAACGKSMMQRRRVQPGFFTWGIKRRQHALRSPWLSKRFTQKAITMAGIKGCNQGFWREDLLTINGFNEEMVGWGPDDKECAARLFNNGIYRKHLRYAALATHLYHRSKAPLDVNPNIAIYENTVTQQLKRCSAGVDNHLAEFIGDVSETVGAL